MSGYPYKSLHDLAIEDVEWMRWQKLVNTVAALFNSPVAFINQASTKGIEVLVASELPTTHYSPGGSASKEVNVYCHHVVQSNTPMYVKDASTTDQWNDNPEYTKDNYVSYLGYPIQWPDGRSFGTLCVMDTAPTDYKQHLFDVFELMRDVINSDLAHIYKENELKVESRLDPLTGIYNRRGFEEAFDKFTALSCRLNRNAQLLFIDLNNFKSINDTLGHEAGDQVLQRFAHTLKSCTRESDLLCRWGGDEFVVMLNSDDQVAQKEFIQRINDKQNSECDNLGAPEICFSAGGAEIAPSQNVNLRDFIHIADQQMYSCKDKAS
ncbi:diguanylate cyclase [Pseudoalteromonas ruthenica]|uniref:diguanylate cyclase n=1 Tax=Pseudoalteromonas ruthenica TaxID=151081 RepID=A0A5S3Z9L0_9GAMM|nr:sensor domain-containing diguanylate cyclase [Pseudoalteromonas ruthenica]TMP88691.1 diguanylate cyclase [Pseudoalteromonas ruthenica]